MKYFEMTKYILLELFSGTGSVGKVFERHNFRVISIDISNKYMTPTFQTDILTFDYKLLPTPDVIWASPPCNSFCTFAYNIAKSRNYFTLEPLKPIAFMGNRLLDKTMEIILHFVMKNPDLRFVIENPSRPAMMWRMPQMVGISKESTCYCLYGFPYKKPTDFFHNFPDGLGLIPREQHKKKCTLVKHICLKQPDVSLEQRYKIPEKLTETIVESFLEQDFYKSTIVHSSSRRQCTSKSCDIRHI